LATEDGLVLQGTACGAAGTATGELCFNTSMTGYQEILTDPSYAGQIITMTAPQIGNYGYTRSDDQREVCHARAMVVREMCSEPSNWRATESLPDYLRQNDIVAIAGVDTRRIVRHLRRQGAVRAVVTTDAQLGASPDALVAAAAADPGLVGRDLVAEVAVTEPRVFDNAGSLHVAAIDTGIKQGIIDRLLAVGCNVTLLPPTTTVDEIMHSGSGGARPDGVFLANGPGDPSAVPYVYQTVSELLGRIPIFGICLGHQMLALAAGARTYKMKFGHRGGNHPVKNLATGRVEITAQNHGFAVDADSLQGLPVAVTHVNLNDDTIEGIRMTDAPAFSVQYHPEASPGPHDSHYLFYDFVQLMEGRL
jgi:carbamoyl-phosphate synthase small subunit